MASTRRKLSCRFESIGFIPATHAFATIFRFTPRVKKKKIRGPKAHIGRSLSTFHEA
jgi:hypothetical protein